MRPDPHFRYFSVADSLVEIRACIRGNRLDLYPSSAAAKIKVLEGPIKLRTRYFDCPDGMFGPGVDSAVAYLKRRYPEAKEL